MTRIIFLAAENGYPAMDYEKFFALMRQKSTFAGLYRT